MIRFMPDSWVDVLMRPLDMMSPEGNIYVEVQAPDVRLAAAIVLAIVVLALGRRPGADRRPAFMLLGVTLLAMGMWLATTGNGRYFTPFLFLLGPLCVGLVRLLPVSTFLRFSTAGLLLLVQGVMVWQAAPLGGWSLAHWRGGSYFQIDTPSAQPRSYVTLTPISFSLIAPQFPAESRWMNVSVPVNSPRDREYARQWLAAARSLTLVAPSYPSQMVDDRQPSATVLRVFEQLLSPRGLSLVTGARCEFLRSRGLADLQQETSTDARVLDRIGFWLCPLRYDPSRADGGQHDPQRPDPVLDTVFEAVERMCPRFFPPGEAQTERSEGMATRHYGNADTRVYVLDDGEVLYKFWRSLNAVTIGRRDDVLAGRVQLDCSRIRAPNWRTGGP